MVVWDDIEKQKQRAQAASFMLPWRQLAQKCADHAGVSLAAIEDATDVFLTEVMADLGFSREEMCGDIPALRSMRGEDRERLLDLFAVERWTAENIRRSVREETPLPFGIAVGGVWLDTSNGNDWPAVWAVATPASDPEAMAKTFLRTCQRAFGKQAFRDVSQHARRGKPQPLTPEEMAAMHQRGMSYREIAIQSLRSEHPDIVENPGAFRSEIKSERARIIKVIRAAQGLWNLRMPEESTG